MSTRAEISGLGFAEKDESHRQLRRNAAGPRRDRETRSEFTGKWSGKIHRGNNLPNVQSWQGLWLPGGAAIKLHLGRGRAHVRDEKVPVGSQAVHVRRQEKP